METESIGDIGVGCVGGCGFESVGRPPPLLSNLPAYHPLSSVYSLLHHPMKKAAVRGPPPRQTVHSPKPARPPSVPSALSPPARRPAARPPWRPRPRRMHRCWRWRRCGGPFARRPPARRPPPPAPRRHRVVPTGWSVVENGESRERRTEKVETAVERPTCQKPWSGVVLSKKVVLAKDVFITVWRCQDPFSGLGPLGTFWFFLLVGCSFFPPWSPSAVSSQRGPGFVPARQLARWGFRPSRVWFKSAPMVGGRPPPVREGRISPPAGGSATSSAY